MKTNERRAGDVTIVDVEGRIVFGDGEEEFRRAVTGAMEAGRMDLVINMAEVPYVDSAGISQLVRTFVTTSTRGGHMKLLKLTRGVRDLLTITRLLTVMESFESEEEAVKSFAKASKPS
jgi:anti-sigma B factor antagonist